MRKIYFILSFLLVAALWLLPVNTGLAKDIQHKFGSMKLPENAYVIEYDLEKDIDKMDEKSKAYLKEMFELSSFYQISINDGQSYRNALAVTIFFDNKLLRKGRENLTEADKQRLSFKYGTWQESEVERIYARLESLLDRAVYEGEKAAATMKQSKIIKLSFADRTNFADLPTGLISYEWTGIDTIKINGEYGYRSKGRLAGYLAGLLLSGYFEVYTHNVQDDGVGLLVFVCPDSEREFWQPIFADSVVQGSL